MTTFSFVHAADVHLDSPFAGITASAPHIRDTMVQASFNAWRNLVDLCLEERVDFLLLGGDIFDWEDRSIRAQLAFRDGCIRLADHGIRVFAVHGNHDPMQGRYTAIQLPDNVKVFGHAGVDTQLVAIQDRPAVAISGISYQNREEKRNLAALFTDQPIPPELFSIGLIHANLGTGTGHAPYAPCSMKDLSAGSIDYWALGHVHARHVVSESPHVVYPGNIQGRSFNEQGERGAYVVRVQGKIVSGLEFRPLDAVRFQVIDVPIEPYQSLDGLVQHMADSVYQILDDIPEIPLICRFVLTGRGLLFSDLIKTDTTPQILESVREYFQDREPFVWIENIRLKCRPEVDITKLMESDGLLSRVLRDMDEMESDPQGLLNLTHENLSSLFGRRLVSGAIGKLTEEDVREMMDQARNLCIDLLGTEDA